MAKRFVQKIIKTSTNIFAIEGETKMKKFFKGEATKTTNIIIIIISGLIFVVNAILMMCFQECVMICCILSILTVAFAAKALINIDDITADERLFNEVRTSLTSEWQKVEYDHTQFPLIFYEPLIENTSMEAKLNGNIISIRTIDDKGNVISYHQTSNYEWFVDNFLE